MTPAAFKALRVTHGISQDDIARLSGISQYTVSAFESGKRNAKRATIESIVAALAFLAGQSDELEAELRKRFEL